MSSATSLVDALRINFIRASLFVYCFYISLDKYNFIVILNVISVQKKKKKKKTTKKTTDSFTEYPQSIFLCRKSVYSSERVFY